MTVVDIQGLEAGYGAVQVLWGVDLALPGPGIACLIGANGAGKTTLLRCISGLVPARAGRVAAFGATLTNAGPAAALRAGVAHVPEGRRLIPTLSVEDNLLLGAWTRRGERALVRRGLDRAYTMFPRLAERRRQDAATLSGGEQQMCAIARGLMSEPRLLLIDELSLGLAPRIAEELAAQLPGIAAGGTSVLLVEQDVALALEISARGFVLDRGRITLAGPAAELLDDPRVREAFLGV